MSELTTFKSAAIFRKQLLSTVSGTALAFCLCAAGTANAESDSRPTVWVELGGQLERVGSISSAFKPDFMDMITQPNLLSAMDVQRNSAYAKGFEGRLTIEPSGSDWVFSASVRYGRASRAKNGHQQTPNKRVPVHVTKYGRTLNYPAYYYPSLRQRFADARSTLNETHTIIDFTAGKDVGLGLFGRDSHSVFSAGVRFAQFASGSSVDLRAEPDLQYPTQPLTKKYQINAWRAYSVRFHDDTELATANRSFHGVGPSLSWDSSLPILGHPDSGEVNIDIGVNGSLLFGRQKAKGHHQSAVQSYNNNHWKLVAQGLPSEGHFTNTQVGGLEYTGHATAHHTIAADFNRQRSVIIPNLGGFAGLSVRYSNAKISFGYRADWFFGAMDYGIDTPKSGDIGFHGPFASISVGLGG